MNITNLAKKWLIEHKDYNVATEIEADALMHKDLDSLCKLINLCSQYGDYEVDYDPKFGDDKTCLCGHSYYRHFDSYENMSAVGCKYCSHWEKYYGNGHCPEFKENKDA